MIISLLQGGLGNQMFQYAAGRALSLRLGLPLKLNIDGFGAGSSGTPRDYALQDFPIQATIAETEEITRLREKEGHPLNRRLRKIFGNRGPWRRIFVKEQHFSHWPNFHRLKAPVHLEGYWQSELYFADYAHIIRNDFAFPPLPSGEATKLAEEIHNSEHSVSVHIRRGDYISSEEAAAFHGTCSPEYYRKSLKTVSEGRPLRLFLFSDDPAWVRDSFDADGHSAVTVDLRERAVHDMHLMSLCRHHIIANSSFSWWGAWLSTGKGITCAPKRWFLDPSLITRDLIPRDWLLLD